MSELDKKALKREYDKAYREKNRELIKVKKAEYYAKNVDRAKEKSYRQANKEKRAEYLKTPRYREWKKRYDKKRRAKLYYGDFYESFYLVLDLEKKLDSVMSNYERKYLSDRLLKKQKRRREYERAKTKC